MKANYKNWMPKELLLLIGIITLLFFLGFILLQGNVFSFQKTLHIILSLFFAIITILGLICFFLFVNMHRMFSYKGKRKLSKHIYRRNCRICYDSRGRTGCRVWKWSFDNSLC